MYYSFSMITQVNNDYFMALSDPTRIRITEMVARNGKMSAGDISSRFTVSFAAISQHLKVLREAEILEVEKQAQKRLYAVNVAAFEDINHWITEIKKQWEIKFSQLDRVLAKQKLQERKK